ncbi:prepilin peptidase [Pectobacterium parmentieri]|uniref:Prepilin leader peptidase/N-methyltransferase n=1 Tax=Pectobacterium parmentieri TaxID=1905730 RepID=A0ABS0S4G9_PECPM|nr:A24 family peptidase [Pectobacterium parmentieri]MBI0472070.1 prepilin peptidase [Pectobacterium parmentieri]MBI0495179.1 prepilin peptidase [Pectobacterium parmentieri]MBI0556231.1 prepilin peptidase [Pectobacterium parmentieri]MBI0569315.1 prepilin peptidase [Pectobacterium parmentieri]MBI0573917.1 prepilin peptidase [Pectobacterium parmentieri]
MTEILFVPLFGLVVGSFFNVVIYRMPRILAGEKLALSWPGSYCPACKHKIKVYHNIPLFGWLWLKGRCAHCQQPISRRYPLVELLTAVLFTLVIARDGITLQSLSDLLIFSLLIPLFFIDLDSMLLPDRLTLLVLVYALLLAGLGEGHTDFSDAVAAAALGFGLPWLLDRFYVWRHGREGMGMGDMKLFAGIGAWLGCQALLHIMVLASLSAIVVVLVLRRKKRYEPFAFGPYVIVAALILYFAVT